MFCYAGQELTGSIRMVANERQARQAVVMVTQLIILFCSFHRQSYDVDIKMEIAETTISSHSKYDLKNPYFRYTTAQQPPPG